MGEPRKDAAELLRDVAQEDLDTVRRSAYVEPILPRSTAFHAQQAVEKLMKAALTAAGVPDYPMTHNLVTLNEWMVRAGLTPIDDAAADFLTPFAVPARYGEEDVDEQRALRAADLAEKLCARLEEIIDEALAKEDPAG
jgi:HEPN domain-containing protein